MNALIRNARVVTAERVLEGCVQIRNGRIESISSGASSAIDALDWEGDWLLPGLVELHTDNLEKHLMPRPGVLWDATSAMLAHDAQCAAAGITTVFDAVVLGAMDDGGSRSSTQHTAIDALHRCAAADLLRVEHFLHVRCELAAADVVSVLNQYLDDPLLRLVSVMDHTPGQRQWRDLTKFRRYAERHGSLADAAFAQRVSELRLAQHEYAARHRVAVVAAARAHQLPLASHDDTDVEQVQQAHAEGVVLSEFPTTLEAAQAARDAGLGVIMGAPNLVKGGSHSGNVSARALAKAELLDIFSSDYVPASLLQAAFQLHDQLDWPLAAAVRTVAHHPAQAIGLADRGDVACGLKADLLRVRKAGHLPVVMETWRNGRRVL